VEAARTSNVEKVALKETTAACKAGAKEKKISWPTSRKYVNDCVAKAFKLTPAEIEKIAVKQATVACKAEAKGKKIGWPARAGSTSKIASQRLSIIAARYLGMNTEPFTYGCPRPSETPMTNRLHSAKFKDL
jgi:hypothetical protein